MRVLMSPGGKGGYQNPYLRSLGEALAAEGVEVVPYRHRRLVGERFDVWHLHWPENVLGRSGLGRRWAGWCARVAYAKARGARVVWTAHNLGPHDAGAGGWWAAGYWAWLERVVDGVLALSEDSVGQLAEVRPGLAAKVVGVTPHGHYRGAYPDTVGRAEARAWLGVPTGARVVGFLGRIEPYKQVEELVRVGRSLEGVEVVVAGACSDPAVEARVRAAAGGDPRVRLRLGRVADEDVQRVLRGCDVVVLPFRSILNSGSAILALSFDRPVVAPRLGSLPELQRQVGSGWVRLYEGELTGGGLEASLTALPQGRPDLSALCWERVAQRTRAAYLRVLGGGVCGG